MFPEDLGRGVGFKRGLRPSSAASWDTEPLGVASRSRLQATVTLDHARVASGENGSMMTAGSQAGSSQEPLKRDLPRWVSNSREVHDDPSDHPTHDCGVISSASVRPVTPSLAHDDSLPQILWLGRGCRCWSRAAKASTPLATGELHTAHLLGFSAAHIKGDSSEHAFDCDSR